MKKHFLNALKNLVDPERTDILSSSSSTMLFIDLLDLESFLNEFDADVFVGGFLESLPGFIISKLLIRLFGNN